MIKGDTVYLTDGGYTPMKVLKIFTAYDDKGKNGVKVAEVRYTRTIAVWFAASSEEVVETFPVEKLTLKKPKRS